MGAQRRVTAYFTTTGAWIALHRLYLLKKEHAAWGLGALTRCFGLSFRVLFEHLFGVDGDEDAAAAGEDFAFVV
jgi:hypothetical protein